MKKTILVFYAIFLSCSAFAQKKVEITTIHQLINKISYEFALQSIEDFENGKFTPDFKQTLEKICTEQDCCSDKCHYEALLFLQAKELGSTVALCKHIESYKEAFSEDMDGKEQYEIVSKILNNDSETQRFKAKRDSSETFQNKLKALNTLIQKTFKVSEKTNTNSPPTETAIQKPASKSNNLLSMITLPLLLLSIAFYVFYLRPRYQKRLLELKQETKTATEEKEKAEGRLNDLRKEIQELKERNAALFENENELRAQIETLSRTSQHEAPRQKHAPAPEYPKNEAGQTVYATFYLPIPNSDGSFDNDNKTSKFDWTETVYKVEVINEARTKAVFSMVNDSRMIKRAISGYDVYIKPVCTALNSFDINATEIITEEKGTLILEGGHWQLEEKAKIRYGY